MRIPTISEIVQKSTPILKHIPIDCRADFGKALNALFFEIAHHNNTLAWLSYFMFVPVILQPYPRGGQKNRKKATLFTQNRIKDWLGNDIVDYSSKVINRIRLWNNLPSSTFTINSDPVARTIRLASAGRYGLACQALAADESIAPLTDATYDILVSKHPAGPEVSRIKSPPSAIHCSVEQVKQSTSTFPVESGAGPSRLSPDHIKEAAVSFLQTSVYEQLTNIVNLIISGNIPAEVQPYFCGAFLSPLVKKDGSIRPVACGDVLRRVSAKVLARAVKDKAATALFPHQLGVAVPGGAEIAVHTWREVVEEQKSNPDAVALKIDLSNAFNNVDRGKFLELVNQHFPELCRFVWLCYGKESYLFIRDSEKIIRSRQGTQQGDPLAFLLSCLVFNIVINEINQLEGIKLNSWFMDDGNIVADYKSVNAIISIFDRLCNSIGVF